MKQITDKLNDIAKAIDENVELPTTDLIIDSLDAITTAFGGTPNDSKLIVDKLDAIRGVAHGGVTPTGNIEITENTPEGEPLDVSQYATATVNVSGGGGDFTTAEVTITTGEGTTGTLLFPIIYDSVEYSMCQALGNDSTGTNTYTMPLYKGEADIMIAVASPPTISVTGDAEYVSADGYIMVTGDCTITLS